MGIDSWFGVVSSVMVFSWLLESDRTCGLVAALGAGRTWSADMLRRARSPLSSRGRFLVAEESASSMELRDGGLRPSEVARSGRPSEDDSMTSRQARTRFFARQ